MIWTILCKKKALKHQWSAGFSLKMILSNGKDAFTVALTIDFLKKATLLNI